MGTPMNGGTGGQHYCLRWNNYQSNMTSVFHQLLQDEAFVDVTLACSGDQSSIRAHKVVLSACSPYFQKLLLENPCKHPVIILPQEVHFIDLQFIIEFVYRGEIDVSHAELPSLLRTAEQLKIKGLCEVAAREMQANEQQQPHEQEIHRPINPRLHYPKVKFSTFSNKRKSSTAFLHDYPHERPYDYHLSAGYMGRPAILRADEDDGGSDYEDYHDEDDEEENMEPKNLVNKNRQQEKEIVDVNANSSTQPALQEPQGAVAVAAVQQRVRDSMGVKLELRGEEHPLDMAIEPQHSERVRSEEDHPMMVTPELLGLIPTSALHAVSESSCDMPTSQHKTTKHWSQEDMDLALEALRTQSMNLTKASATFGIPSTTLWQRAHRLGINTPKKDNQAKTWSEADLNLALDELRAGRISANRASKTFHIPSSTLYKIARKEGIKLSAPFNASPTTWNSDDLNRALEAIRSGASVQKAAQEFGIPSGTLYGRCKREGIELNKNTPVPWSHTDMTEALEAVRVGDMSINQAAIHFNLPYSSLYGRFKRVKCEGSESGSKYDYDLRSNSSDPGTH